MFLGYQKRWIYDQSRVRFAEKSRRIGWSWMCAYESVEAAARQRSPVNTWYVSYNKDSTKQFIIDCLSWAEALQAFAETFDEQVLDGSDTIFSLKFPTGKQITALACAPANLRYKDGRIILDEAAHYPDFPEMMKAARAIIQQRKPGSRIDVISTHNGVDSAFNQYINKIRSGELPYSLHRCTFDDAIIEGYYRHIICPNLKIEWTFKGERAYREEVMAEQGDSADEELLCIPNRSGGTYLPRDIIERCMQGGDVCRLTLDNDFLHLPEEQQTSRVQGWLEDEVGPVLRRLPKTQLHFFGEDFGRNSDRTVITVGYLEEKLKRVFPLAVELSNVPYEQQKQILIYVVDRLPRFVKGALDNVGNGGYLSEAAIKRYGQQRIELVNLSEKWYREQLPPFKAALENEQCTLVEDADHLLDLSAFKVLKGIPKLPDAKTKSTDKKAKPRHGDAGVSYALAHYASRLPFPEYDYHSVKELHQTAARSPLQKPPRNDHPLRGFRSRPGGLY